MQEGPDGLQPAKGFMNSAMAPERSFNDPLAPEGMFRYTVYSLPSEDSLHIEIRICFVYRWMKGLNIG